MRKLTREELENSVRQDFLREKERNWESEEAKIESVGYKAALQWVIKLFDMDIQEKSE